MPSTREDGRGLLVDAAPSARGRAWPGSARSTAVEPGLQLVVVDGVAALAGERRVDDVLDRLQHAAAIGGGRLEERHGHVAPGDELLDQQARRVAREQLATSLVQRAPDRSTTESWVMPFELPSKFGFTITG